MYLSVDDAGLFNELIGLDIKNMTDVCKMDAFSDED